MKKLNNRGAVFVGAILVPLYVAGILLNAHLTTGLPMPGSGGSSVADPLERSAGSGTPDWAK